MTMIEAHNYQQHLVVNKSQNNNQNSDAESNKNVYTRRKSNNEILGPTLYQRNAPKIAPPSKPSPNPREARFVTRELSGPTQDLINYSKTLSQSKEAELYRNSFRSTDSLHSPRRPVFPELKHTQNVVAVKPLSISKMSIVGLSNLGNTCFMNAVLQCLIHIEPLARYFHRAELHKDINPASGCKGVLAISFSQLVKELFNLSSGSTVTPSAFKKMVATLSPDLLDYEQQDCQEFLRFILNGLSDDLCRSQRNSDVDGTSTATDTVKEDPSIATTSSPSDSTKKSAIVSRIRKITFENREGVDGQSSCNDVVERGSENSNDQYQKLSVITNNLEADAVEPFSLMSESSGQSSLSASMAVHRSELGQYSVCESPISLSSSSGNYRTAVTVDPTLKHVITQTKLMMQSTNTCLTNATIPSAKQEVLSVHEAADAAWRSYLKSNDSIITDIFGGQLQSTIECLTCHHRSFCFDPFLDVSIPIPTSNAQPMNTVLSASNSKNSLSQASVDSDTSAASGPVPVKGLWNRWSGNKEPQKCTLEDCLAAYTATEILDGENAYLCEKCKVLRKCSKKLNVHSTPYILVIHIKRFQYTSVRRNKLCTDVTFPLTDLDMTPFMSAERLSMDLDNSSLPLTSCNVSNVSNIISHSNRISKNYLYDLSAVAHHSGSMNGGHYIADVDTNSGHPNTAPNWVCFNDATVSKTTASSINGPSAYVLFYRRKENQAHHSISSALSAI